MNKKAASLLAGFAAICVVLSTVAATYSVTLKSSQPVSEQAKALSNYIAQLPAEKQEDIVEELELIVSAHKIVYSQRAKISGMDAVFISDKGEKYHCNSDCRGLRFADNISGVTKEAAIAMGRTPCAFCYPNGDDN